MGKANYPSHSCIYEPELFSSFKLMLYVIAMQFYMLQIFVMHVDGSTIMHRYTLL